MNKNQINWQSLGKLPSDPSLESQLDSIRHQNTNSLADHTVWIASLERNVVASVASDREYLEKLESSISS